MPHPFQRTELLLGKEALKKLHNSTVAVFGIGGVGSFSVEALARCGVGKLILVDNDCVCITNINRQIHATTKSIGKPKVSVMKDRILEINPGLEVITHQVFYAPQSSRELIKPDYDYIIDAVDTVSAKVDIVITAKMLGIPVISCMGAGNKLDPTKFKVSDIYKTSVCPLARVMRSELRKREIKSLKVVYSKEPPVTHKGLVLTDSSTNKQIPGSVSFVPSVAGLIIAGEVIKDLIR